jgi:two-component system, NtrC family, response regulator HydG
MCWTICALTSGYISRTAGKEIYVLEDGCVGSGDAGCHLLGRTREEWGDERAQELRFFEPGRLKECLDVSLHWVTETLKATERKLREHRRGLVRVAPDVEEPLGVIAKSAAMERLVDLARRVARFDATVLITGESGSGKERIARLIHEESTRSTGPFIAVNCGAITETLLESELFGHARGAFTGANQDRPGLFEAANNGTLLLDEVGEISKGMQVKLLRALQEREIRRVGENKNRRIDLRVLAATNRDLSLAVADGGGCCRGGPPRVPIPMATKGALRSLDEIERDYIIAALKVNGGSQTHTAEQLKIGSATLYRKLKRYGMIVGKDPLGKGAVEAEG